MGIRLVNKRLSIITVLLLLLITSHSMLTYSPVSAAVTLQVPSAEHPTIQSALNAVTDGATINVAAGTYKENINSNKFGITDIWKNHTQVTLQGSANTIIDGNVALYSFKELKMDGFTITGTLTIGDALDGLVEDSLFTNLQVAKTTIVSGVNNKISKSVLNQVQLAGASTYGTGSANLQIESNIISGGVNTGGVATAKIVGNTIANTQIGINDNFAPQTRYGSGANTIANNTISNCNVGISVYSSTYYHGPDNITQNKISNNAVGIEISGKGDSPVSNIIYNNQFIDNGLQVKINGDFAETWSFGTPLKGSYWSDYMGVDANGDGIGDTPYIINANNKDDNPLMGHLPVTPAASAQPNASPNASPSHAANSTSQGTILTS